MTTPNKIWTAGEELLFTDLNNNLQDLWDAVDLAPSVAASLQALIDALDVRITALEVFHP